MPEAKGTEWERNFILRENKVGSDVTCQPRSVSLGRVGDSDDMCGFQLGEFVTTLESPDAGAPWQNMGDGKVMGPGWKKGFLDVQFRQSRRSERFEIRAKNLKRASGVAPPEKPHSEMKKYGISLWDPVIYQDQDKGVVLGEGPTPDTVMVKFSGIGAKSVRLALVCKVALTALSVANWPEQKSLCKEDRLKVRRSAAAAWAGVTLTTDEIMSRTASLHGLGDSCFVKSTCHPWSELGVGMVEDLGEEPGTVRVRFNVQQESWTFKSEHLQKVQYPGPCEFVRHKRKTFDCTDEQVRSDVY